MGLLNQLLRLRFEFLDGQHVYRLEMDSLGANL